MKVLPAIPISLLLLDAIGLLHIDIAQLKELPSSTCGCTGAYTTN
jgi:hypothetical protein